MHDPSAELTVRWTGNCIMMTFSTNLNGLMVILSARARRFLQLEKELNQLICFSWSEKKSG